MIPRFISINNPLQPFTTIYIHLKPFIVIQNNLQPFITILKPFSRPWSHFPWISPAFPRRPGGSADHAGAVESARWLHQPDHREDHRGHQQAPHGAEGTKHTMGHGMNPAGRWFFGLYIGISRWNRSYIPAFFWMKIMKIYIPAIWVWTGYQGFDP